MERIFPAILLVLAFTLPVYAQQPTIVGHLSVLTNSPLYLAQEKGYFKEQGLNVRLESLPAGRDVLVMLSAGQFHVGTTTIGSATFNAWKRGMDVVAVATMSAFYPDPKAPAVTPFVVRKKSIDAGEIKGIPDLKGKKCAINSRGVKTEFDLDKVMRQGGMTIDDIDLVTMPFPDMVTALDTGAIYCAILAEPLTTLAEDKGIAVRMAGNFAPGSQTLALFYNTRFARERRADAERFMVAYLKGIRDLYGEGWRSDENTAIITKYTRVAVPVLKKAVTPYVDPDGRLELASLREQQLFYMRRGTLAYKELINEAEMIDDSFRERAVLTLGPFRR